MTDVATIPPGCIPPNPDIAGIGIRVSVYAQNIMAIATTAWAMEDGRLSTGEWQVITGQTTTIILTTGALFLAAFLQAANYGMSTYHALVVLNLGWVNVASMLLNQNLSSIPRAQPLRPARGVLPRTVKLLCFLCGALSIVLFAAFGVWFWATVNTFGSRSQCSPRLPIPIRILGHTIALTDPTARKVFLGIYSVGAFLFFGALIVGTWHICKNGMLPAHRAAAPPSLHGGIPPRPTGSRLVRFWLKMMIISGFSLGVIVSTESMVHKAASFVQQGESQWTFGQTVAVLLLAPSTLAILNAMAIREEDEAKKCEHNWESSDEE